MIYESSMRVSFPLQRNKTFVTLCANFFPVLAGWRGGNVYHAITYSVQSTAPIMECVVCSIPPLCYWGKPSAGWNTEMSDYPRSLSFFVEKCAERHQEKFLVDVNASPPKLNYKSDRSWQPSTLFQCEVWWASATNKSFTYIYIKEIISSLSTNRCEKAYIRKKRPLIIRHTAKNFFIH